MAVNRFRERLGADDGGCIIGMVAALVPWKGHRIFIRAAREVCRIDENVRFVIAGGDTFGDHPGYLDDLRKTCTEASLDGRLTFTGHVEDVMPLMAACDIVVLPSSNEPFGRVILEAMALEKAVVAVGAGGPRDIIEHGVSGILVDPHDHGVIAAEIMKLVDDPDKRRGMGRAGRERVEKWFRIDRIVRDVECVYDAVTRVNAS